METHATGKMTSRFIYHQLFFAIGVLAIPGTSLRVVGPPPDYHLSDFISSFLLGGLACKKMFVENQIHKFVSKARRTEEESFERSDAAIEEGGKATRILYYLDFSLICSMLVFSSASKSFCASQERGQRACFFGILKLAQKATVHHDQVLAFVRLCHSGKKWRTNGRTALLLFPILFQASSVAK